MEFEHVYPNKEDFIFNTLDKRYMIHPMTSGGGSGPTPSVNLESKTLTVTNNGSDTILPSSGYDGISQVNLTVNVTPNLQSKTANIDSNGTIVVTPDNGYAGLSSVTVNTSVSGGGNVLPNGFLFVLEGEEEGYGSLVRFDNNDQGSSSYKLWYKTSSTSVSVEYGDISSPGTGYHYYAGTEIMFKIGGYFVNTTESTGYIELSQLNNTTVLGYVVGGENGFKGGYGTFNLNPL